MVRVSLVRALQELYHYILQAITAVFVDAQFG